MPDPFRPGDVVTILAFDDVPEHLFRVDRAVIRREVYTFLSGSEILLWFGPGQCVLPQPYLPNISNA